VRDPDGETTWMHRRTLSGRRAARALETVALRARPDPEAPVEGRAEEGAILWLERCRAGWCRLEAGGVRGWAAADALWGVYAWEARGGDALEPSERPCYRSGDVADAADAAGGESR
jgi:SH3-like domain-containing protein